MKNKSIKFFGSALIAFGMVGMPAFAQAPAGNAAPQQGQAQPQPQPWSANCVTDGRKGNLECLMQQRVVMTNTGQLLASMTVRIPDNNRRPFAAVQVPFGINLPDGLKLEVGNAALENLAFRTCDGGGCYAEGELKDNTIASLRKAESVNVVVKDLSGREVKVPVSLEGFSAAFDKIR